MKKILGVKVTDEDFDRLLSEQSKGKELKVIDNKVVAVEHEVTQEELLKQELQELDNWFNWYDNQVSQYNRCQRRGIEFDKDINELDQQAKITQERIAEIRSLLEKNN